jgi:hypothetical protein
MLRLVNQKLLTLVVFTFLVQMFFSVSNRVEAAPHLDAPNPSVKEDPPATTLDPARLENLSFSEINSDGNSMEKFVTYFNKRDYYYPYRKELGVHAGVVFGFQDSSDDANLMNALLGIDYLLPSGESPRWNVGADFSFVGHEHFYVMRRIVYNEKGSFRPYYEYGLMHKFVPKEKFASTSNWDNYLLRTGIGLADIVHPPKSVDLKLEFAVGAKDFLMFFTYGYTWGF